MHIETVRIFCDLAELLSFSKTAEKNLLSQSAVSQQLAQLELTHQCQLINRKKRPIELTREGQLLYRAAKDILDRYEQLKSELKSLKSSTGSRMKVAAIFSIGMYVLPDYIKRFMVNNSDVQVDIEYLGAAKIYELTLAGDIDIGLLAIPRRDKRLNVYDFQDEPLVLVCSPNNLLADKSRVDIHGVQFERFIAFGKDVPTRVYIDNILQRYNIIVRPVMEFDNTETIKRAVEINSGISILPQTTVLQEIHSGTLKAIMFSNEHFSRPTGIIVRKDKILSQASRYFIEMLRKKT
jgi:DNA-binding transcriptional LysR family regulator